MSNENNPSQNNQPEESSVDLSSLENLQFKTAWTPSSSTEDRKFFRKSFDAPRKSFGDRKPREGAPASGAFAPKDRPRRDFKDGQRKPRFQKDRPQRDAENAGKQPSSADGKSERKPFRKNRDGKFEKKTFAPFKFTMDVLFYPEDAAFSKLSTVMKRLKRTYQLFDIANLILEKPERFIVVAKNLPDADGKISPLYCAQPLNLPFETEEAAKKSAVDHYIEELFAKEVVDVEPPKGNFQVVNICSLGGELLGAPNWHRYNEFLKEFHAEKYPNISFERFLSSIESSREPEKIATWLETMKKREVFKLKDAAEGEENMFETREAAANYILRKYADGLVKVYETVRMRGSNIALLPHGQIRRNMEEMLKNQRRFPIITANNLRGRLRRTGFAIYKRGAKSYAFVSAVKRKFLFEGESFSERPQKVFDYILANPSISSFTMPYAFLGLELPEINQKPKSLAEEHSVAATAQDAPATDAETSAETPEATAQDTQETPEGEVNTDAKIKADLDIAQEIVSEEAVKDSAKEEAKILKYSDEQLRQIKDISRELMWLISEGYVVEYADATLQANPYMPKPKTPAKAEAEGIAEQQKVLNEADDEPACKTKPDEPALLNDTLAAAETDIPSDSEASDVELSSPIPENVGQDSHGEECCECSCTCTQPQGVDTAAFEQPENPEENPGEK